MIFEVRIKHTRVYSHTVEAEHAGEAAEKVGQLQFTGEQDSGLLINDYYDIVYVAAAEVIAVPVEGAGS